MPPQNYDPAVRPATQMRRTRQHLARDDQWIQDFLKRAQTCTISTCWEGVPFNNATMFWYDEGQHRIIFHANASGRVRANIEHNPKVCFSCEEMGNLLPSNAAIEFSVQYRGVVAFGEARIINEPSAAREALYSLISKYFPKMQPGQEYRPITDVELRRTSVFEITITEWSGKENWAEKSDQIDDAWEPLSEDIFNGEFK